MKLRQKLLELGVDLERLVGAALLYIGVFCLALGLGALTLGSVAGRMLTGFGLGALIWWWQAWGRDAGRWWRDQP